MKSYNELLQYSTFEDRFDYLKINNYIGMSTFGFSRYINQQLYKSREWLMIKNKVILRDNACDMGLQEYPLYGKRNVVVHHINSITIEMIQQGHEYLFSLENLICVSFNTHNEIHFGRINGNDLKNRTSLIERFQNDTIPWK